jgi:cytochrome c oxidase assembly protein subunit 15
VTTEYDSVQRLLRLLATAGAALLLVVIVSSAFLRLAAAGLSCGDWPACYGRVDPDAVITSGQRLARLAHRIAATGVGAILLGLSLIAWTQRPPRVRQGVIVAVCLVIVAGLAVLGVATPSARLPAVTLGNLAGGFALFALLAWLRLTVSTPEPLLADAPGWVKLVAALSLLALIGQIALGAMVSAQFAALACPAFPGCGATWPEGALLASLDPLRELGVDANGSIARPPSLAALHFAHRVGGAIVIVLIAVLAGGLVSAAGRARRFGAIVIGLALAQGALGASAVLAQLPLAAVVAHNAIAALLLAALAAVNYRLNASNGIY